MGFICKRCLRELTANERHYPTGMCDECDPKGPSDELGDNPPGHVTDPEAGMAHVILRQTPLHPNGWVTVTFCRDRFSANVRMIELRRQYPLESYKIEVVE